MTAVVIDVYAVRVAEPGCVDVAVDAQRKKVGALALVMVHRQVGLWRNATLPANVPRRLWLPSVST